MLRFTFLAVNLIVPGSGLAALGHFRLAFVTQLSLMATVAVLCWSRLVFEPIGILLGLIVIAIVYLVSSASCLILKHQARISIQIYATIFVLVSLACLAAGFVVKDKIFGVHIFFVPSMSMYPALKPGEFILIDTWAYRNADPKIDDVVVFKHNATGQWLVKRVAKWPDGNLLQNGHWYLLGDNPRQSSDSRDFGGVETAAIIGKARVALASYDGDRFIFSESYPQVIH